MEAAESSGSTDWDTEVPAAQIRRIVRDTGDYGPNVNADSVERYYAGMTRHNGADCDHEGRWRPVIRPGWVNSKPAQWSTVSEEPLVVMRPVTRYTHHIQIWCD